MGLPTRSDRPSGEKTIRIALSDQRVRLRVALVAALVLIAAASFAYGIHSAVSSEPGLQEITVQASGKLHCGDAFTLVYDLGAGETSATKERKALQSLYSAAAVDAYQLFSVEAEDRGDNLRAVNSRVNETVAVDPALYDALALLETSGTRYHYLAPVYALYTSLFQSQSDAEAADYDPFLSEELRAFYRETAAWINDPDAISLELLGNSTVRLNVSARYLSFAEENGITCFLDLFWMKNACIADYIAGILIENGYSQGALVSRDGFVRCLGGMSDGAFSYALLHREGNTISLAETVSLSGAASLAYLHDYPLGSGDENSYYICADGAIRSPYIDPADGLCRAAMPELAASSGTLSCTELALALAPVFIADTPDEAALRALAQGASLTLYGIS